MSITFDGRTARKQKNMDTMLYAGLQIVQRGYWRPTVKEIAELSSVSERTFFSIFGSVENFYEALLLRHEMSLRACLPEDRSGNALIRIAVTGKPQL